MEPDRRAKLKSYAWLTTLAMLLALFVPLASAGAQDSDPDGDTLSAQDISEEGGTLDAIPESATNLVPETGTNTTPQNHTIDVAVAPDDDTPDDEQVTVVAVVDDPAENDSYDGGLPDGTNDSEACNEGDTGDDCQVTLTGVIVESGKDRVRVFRDDSGDGAWQQDEDHDWVTKTWAGPEDAGDTARLGGEDRIETAVEISQNFWATHDDATDDRESAEHVVIARANDFPDALAGTPLATLVDAPQLLTFPDTLDERSETELQRVLATDEDDETDVYLLGQTDAISLGIEARIQELGYDTERLGGLTRFDTAVDIAEEIEEQQGSEVEHIFIARSHVFPDALAGGAAAAHVGEHPPAADDEPTQGTVGAILITFDGGKAPQTEAFIRARDGQDADGDPNNETDATTYALAGPLYNEYSCDDDNSEPSHIIQTCDPEDDETADFALWGFDRHGTARAIGEFFFTAPATVGIARSDKFPDALTGGAHIGRFGGPIILTPTNDLHLEAERYLCYEADVAETAYIYGEVAAVSDATAAEVDAAIDGQDCPDFLDPGIYALQTQTVR